MNIIEAIQLGLRRGYYQYKQLNDSPLGFEDKMTEYLLTVFVSIELNNITLKINQKKIKLEYPFWQFYTNAFPKIKQLNKKDLFNQSKFIRSEYQKKKTKQRIDIVVIGKDDDENERSFHGIELKAINTNYDGIVNDIKRLSKAMITTDLSDNNSIDFCFFGCIKSYKNNNHPITQTEIDEKRSALHDNIEKILDNKFRNKAKFNKLEYNIDYTEIASQSSEEYLNSYSGIPDTILDYHEAIEITGEAMGIVIEIKRK